MNTALIIASRELRDRSRLFLMAAVLAVVPFAIALLPGARADRATTIALTGGTFAVALGFGAAIILGASTIGRELAEKRLSFLFSKPVAPASIWFGKAAAALATSLGCFLLIIVPAYLASRQVWVTTTLHYAAAAAIVFLFFVSHAVTTMVRSRSALVALDFALALLSAAAVYLMVRPLMMGGAAIAVVWLLGSIAVALLAILAVAPVVQLTLGRTDARRSHAALSRAIWIPVAVVLAIAGAYVAWLINVGPSDLNVFALVQSPASDMTVVSGVSPARGDYAGTLLVDAKSGRYERLYSPPWYGVDISRNGKTLAWMQPAAPWSDDKEVFARALDDPNAKSVATGITMTGNPSLVLSDDGSRVAVSGSGLLAVYDLATGKLLASSKHFDERTGKAVFFVTPDLVRVVEYFSGRHAEAVTFTIYELDVKQRKLTTTGKLAGQSGFVPVSVSADGSKMLVRRDGIIADARTGATLATIPPAASVYASAMLHDGRVATVTSDAKGAMLALYAADGTRLHQLALPGSRSAWVSGETTDGKVILVGYSDGREKHGKGRTMYVVDPNRGAIERAVGDTKGPLPRFSIDPRPAQYRAGMKLVGVNADGKLVEW